MGGDFGPSVVVHGALRALPRLAEGARIVFFGDGDAIRAEMKKAGIDAGTVDVVHAPENIDMSEAPAAAVRRKKGSSIVTAAKALRDGSADAFVSAGNTGAMVAANLLYVGRLPGVSRPAIATFCPTRTGFTLFIDVGANVDSKPHHLVQFAAMGRIYVEHLLDVDNARVGLLNIGEEASKGNELAQETYKLLAEREEHFIGNVESSAVFAGKADVVVCDGFVGNILLKSIEGFAGFLMGTIRHEIQQSIRARVGGWMLKRRLKTIFKGFDYVQYGGAPLLGCRGLSIICHGKSNEQAIANAVLLASRGVRERLGELISAEIEREGIAESGSPEGVGTDRAEGGEAVEPPKGVYDQEDGFG